MHFCSLLLLFLLGGPKMFLYSFFTLLTFRRTCSFWPKFLAKIWVVLRRTDGMYLMGMLPEITNLLKLYHF